MYFKERVKIIITLLLLSSIAGCIFDKSVDEYLILAEQHLAMNDNNKAIIELKNVLRKAPENAKARMLLGNIYLSLGDGKSAEKELRKAHSLGYEEAGINLLKAYNIQQKNEEILLLADKINSNDGANQATVEIYRALSQYQLGDNDGAESSINNAVQLSAESMFSRLGAAYLASKQPDHEDALVIVNQLIKDQPDFIEALLLQGQLYFSTQNYNAALAAFERYQELQPEDLTIKLRLANTYIKSKQFDIAEESIDLVLKEAPNHALSNQLKGIIRYNDDDYKGANYHLEKAIQQGLSTSANKILVGISAFQMKNYEQAYYYLNNTKELLLANKPVLKMLAISQLKLGYNIEANEVLLGINELDNDDFSLYSAVSTELVRKGNIEEANKLRAKLGDMSLNNPVDIARQGIFKLSMDDIEGITNIEKALALQPNISEAKIALAQAYISTDQLDKALTLVNDWVAQSPNDVTAYNVLAIIKLKLLDTIGAEKALNAALQINNANPLSLMYFSEQDLVLKQPLKAMTKLEVLLASKPHYLPALSTYYVSAANANKIPMAVAKIKSSFNTVPKSIHHRLLYAKTLIIDKRPKEVIELLTQVDQNSYLPPFYWVALGESLIFDNQLTEALSLYKQWANKYPNQPMSWVKSSITAELNKSFDESLHLVNKGLEYLPQNKKLIVLQTYFNLKNKQFKNAQLNIDNMLPELRQLAIIQGFQGQIWAEQKHFNKAVPKLELSYQSKPSSNNAGLLYFTLRAQNNKNEAKKFLEQHIEQHPSDYKMRYVLANILMRKNSAAAYEHFLFLQKQDPNNFAVLNNLAWSDYQRQNYKQAHQWGLKALALSPENPHILDTMGLILLKLDNKQQAIVYLKQANKLQPNNEEIERHYKEAL